MSKISIAILGTKGGVGKTTVSHMLSFGLAKFDYKIMHVTTDVLRQNLADDNRPYSTRSGQTPEQLAKLFKWFNQKESDDDIALVIDGGGNREQLDNLLSKHVDIIILPFRDSEEDIRVVTYDMNRISNALALPSSWPTNIFAKNQANVVINKMQSQFPNRLLEPVDQLRATQSLLVGDFSKVDYSVSSASKKLAEQVLLKLNINPYEKE